MTCTVVAFAGLKASDYKELLKLDHSNGDTLRVNGKVDGKGPVLTAGEDLAVFTIDHRVGSMESFSLGCQFWGPDPASPNQLVGILDELRFFTPAAVPN